MTKVDAVLAGATCAELATRCKELEAENERLRAALERAAQTIGNLSGWLYDADMRLIVTNECHNIRRALGADDANPAD